MLGHAWSGKKRENEEREREYLGQHLMFNSESLDLEGFFSTMILRFSEEELGFEFADMETMRTVLQNFFLY